MITRLLAVLLVSGLGGAARAAAEDAPYAEYRLVREMGQIQVITGFMNRTPDLPSHLSALERQRIVVLETDRPRTFTRTEQVAGHRVLTTRSISPPVGHGEGGASSFVDLTIVVDGKPRVDCPLWRAAIGIDRIVVEPERGFITLTAHDGILRFDGFEPRGVVDAEWLTTRAEFVRHLIVGRK